MNSSIFLSLKTVFCFVIIFIFSQETAKASCVFEKEIDVQELDIGNMLSWTTVQEVSNQYFVIEKSVNGIDFKTIGQIDAAGDSESANKYRYLDTATGEMMAFYRLQFIEFDGTSAFTKTMIINRSTQNNLVITGMSNLMTDGLFSLTIRSNQAGSCQYTIADLNRHSYEQEVFEVVEGVNVISFDLQNLPIGDYQLSVLFNKEKESVILQKVSPSDMPLVDYVVKE